MKSVIGNLSYVNLWNDGFERLVLSQILLESVRLEQSKSVISMGLSKFKVSLSRAKGLCCSCKGGFLLMA